MHSVFIHPLAAVLSAYGIGLADVLVIRQKAIERPLDEALLRICMRRSRPSRRRRVPKWPHRGF